MDTPFLSTKLYIPPLRPNLVPRLRLIQQLDEGLEAGRRLTLVSAPAGFGKTTLITEWVCSSAREVAWVSLDEADNDPARFLTYLVAALQQVDGSIGQTIQPLLQAPQFTDAGALPAQSLVAPLIHDVIAADTPTILVLDDYHLISSATVHHTLEFLLEHLPPMMHLAISTRQDPPIPLPRLRVRSQMTEIREQDLRFTPQEAATFLDRTMGLKLSPQTVQALETRTEGWIAGLQLAAIALQSTSSSGEEPTNVQDFIAAFTGDDRYVMDYLIAEVLQRQPPSVRDFVRQTAILDRLTAPLCDAVTGRHDGQATLEQLERADVFLSPLDHRREWYRYHRLFAEFLRATLTPEEKGRLHHRASRWYESRGFTSQAITHALASGDLDHAERLVRPAAEATIHRGGLLTVRGWLDALPDERVRADPELATCMGWTLALTGEMARAEEYADAAETCLERAGVAPAEGQNLEFASQPANFGQLLALQAFIALLLHQDYERAIRVAGRALRALAPGQSQWRVIALWAKAESQERTGSIMEAIVTLREARRASRALDKTVFGAAVELFLATALHMHGQRREAVAACVEAIDRYRDASGRPWPVAGLLFSQLGTLYYEANQLELAREHVDQGLALGEQLALDGSTMFSVGFAAPTLHAQGETEAALAALRKAHQLVTQTGLADADWPLAGEADIRLQQGDLPFALRWAENAGLSPDTPPQYVRMHQHVTYARLLLATNRLSDARRWLARLERFAHERDLVRWLISIHLLQALAAERSGQRSAAHDRLARAVRLAAPQDYLRAFLDEDRHLIALLPEVRDLAPAFVDQLLHDAQSERPGGKTSARPPMEQPLVEPLSERELEVLGLIAAGLSNREIAQELYITVGTVKRHINNSYGKLGVHSRTQAIAKTRELRLLETHSPLPPSSRT